MPTFPPAAVPGPLAPAGSAGPPSPRHPGSARPFVAAVLVACLVLSLVPEALAEPAGPYAAPVEAPVVDGYRAIGGGFGISEAFDGRNRSAGGGL